MSRFRALPDAGPPRHPATPNPHVRVVIPYVLERLRRETRAWGEANGAEFVDVSSDDEAYWRLMRDLWRDGATFMLVEHDNVPPDGAVEGLAACLEDWCGHVYPRAVGWDPSVDELGCTRFSRSLTRRVPDVFDDPIIPAHHRPAGESPRHWMWIAAQVEWSLLAAGVRFHVHAPPALHLHEPAALACRELRRNVRHVARLRAAS